MDKLEMESKKIGEEIFKKIINKIQHMDLSYQMDKFNMLFGIIEFLEEKENIIYNTYKGENDLKKRRCKKMNKQKLEELTNLLNTCTFAGLSTDVVEDRLKYLAKEMKRLETDNIQSRGLYTRKDEFGGIEAGILIPVIFFKEEENNEQ